MFTDLYLDIFNISSDLFDSFNENLNGKFSQYFSDIFSQHFSNFCWKMMLFRYSVRFFVKKYTHFKKYLISLQQFMQSWIVWYRRTRSSSTQMWRELHPVVESMPLSYDGCCGERCVAIGCLTQKWEVFIDT